MNLSNLDYMASQKHHNLETCCSTFEIGSIVPSIAINSNQQRIQREGCTIAGHWSAGMPYFGWLDLVVDFWWGELLPCKSSSTARRCCTLRY